MRGISDWQRCQYPARYGMTAGELMEARVCVEHLQPTIENGLANMQPGKDNVSGFLVWRLRNRVGTGRPGPQCDYRFRESPSAPLAP